jgi:16S rRNA (adenine1518-N6/adenine1519-N6)-dimethyltransferase
VAQTLTQIKALLAEQGLRPKHKFGQNFLHDHNQLRKIMAAARIQPGDCVLEVGPGTGALTEQLLDAGADVVAVEIDRDLEPILRQRLAQRITLHIGSALAGKHELSPEVLALLADRPFKLIANLPYNIASPLLANLAIDVPAMAMAVVMVQREVADRLTAEPGGKDYGPLGIIIQAMCAVQKVATLAPGCFWPPPKVGSAVVKLTRRPTPLTEDPQALADLLHRLFSKRRKQLGSILGRGAALPIGIDPAQRPEQLTLAQLEALARTVSRD